jgi:hypothetical protein
MSTFKYAGVSTLNGKIKARFANDQMRVKVLAKNGHKDIDIIELKHPMTKDEAVAFLLKINFDNGNATVRAAIEAEVEKRTEAPKAAKAAPKAKAAPAKKSKPSMDAIKAKAKAAKAKSAPAKTVVTKAEVDAQLENAPF